MANLQANPEMIKEKINSLRNEVIKHTELYEQNKPIISDGEYDALFRELVQLEAEYPEFRDPNSPTQRIVTKMVDELKKVRHNRPMISQEKAHTWEDVLKFINRAEGDILCQFKLDGLTVVLHYENGELKMAVTRGDGEVGEDITHTVLTISNVPKHIPYNGKLEVRMEAIIPFEDFKRINENEEYSNPRNLVSGTLRQLDPEIARPRNVQGIIFEFESISAEDIHFENDTERLEFLSKQGFEVVNTKVFPQTEEGLNQLKSYLEQVEKELRSTLPYMIDGLVLKFNNLKAREQLGETSHHPRWGIAYKFEAMEATTTMHDITEQVGKTGQITPVGELVTVNIDGVNISRATLHNYGYISEKDIRIGDRVTVIRANDVIPQITNSIKDVRTGEEKVVEPPKNCPVCGSTTEFIGANLYCTGLDCEPQLKGKIEYFASRKALNIDGLGKSTVEAFFKKGLIHNFLDLYRLEERKEEVLSIERYGEKKFEKLIKGLEEAKKAPLSKVITGLSIRLIDNSNAKIIAKEFKNMQAILDASLDVESFQKRIMSLEGFGEKMTQSVVDFFSNPNNRELIQEMMNLGFTMTENSPETDSSNADSQAPTSEAVAGKTFVITGKLSKSRDEFKEMIENMGGKVTGSVSKKTNFLLMGPDVEGTSKHKKALESGTTILSEQDFWNLINQ